MNFEFSPHHRLVDFAEIKVQNKVYFGFASSPTQNVFSQKFKDSIYSSTTQMFRQNTHLFNIEIGDEATFVLHTVEGLATLDVATAAFAASQTEEALNSDAWLYLANYVNEIEMGITRAPFLRSLYAFYYSTCSIASKYYPDEDQIPERNIYVLKQYWSVLNTVLEAGLIDNYDAPNRFMDLIPNELSTASQEDEIENEANRYFRHDYPRAEMFEVDLPLKSVKQFTKYSRVNLLAISDPSSNLLKFFCRNPMAYPDGEERVYQCMYVHDPYSEGKRHEHRISVLPNEDFNLKGLTDILEEMEDEARRRKGFPPRPKDNPREESYRYNDPWYDERHASCSIVDTPGDGSTLDRSDILEALWYYGAPLHNIVPQYVTCSVFIPFWSGSELTKMITEASSDWQNTVPEKNALKWFFPFVENIFSSKSEHSNQTGHQPLISYEYQQPFSLNLVPDFGEFEGIAIDVVQRKSLEKSIDILNKSAMRLVFHQYEYGLSFFEIIIDPVEGDCSIFDTQWLEQCITLTPFKTLLEPVLSAWKGRFGDRYPKLESSIIDHLEMPNKHFVSTTLTQFKHEGGLLSKGRSTGGALQMMVCDENPTYKNLPHDSAILTTDSVLDITSKRHYFCSSSSLLNFDDVATHSEHIQAHEATRIIFNMALAQRFILSKSRLGIILAERNYHDRKKISLWRWLGQAACQLPGLFMSQFSDSKGHNRPGSEVNISKLRADIQHMTTSSWFHVISSKKPIQEIFYNIRSAMEINQLYQEVQDRCVELDEFIMKKESTKQSRIFEFFAFIMSPLGLIVGFAGGLEFNTWEVSKRNPFPSFLSWIFPGLKDYDGSVWPVLGIYFLAFLGIIGCAWILHKWWSYRD